jgi:hypothetical protein
MKQWNQYCNALQERGIGIFGLATESPAAAQQAREVQNARNNDINCFRNGVCPTT